MAVGLWGIQPGEFWAMSHEEWWWLYDVKVPKENKHGYAGRLTESDVAELYELISG